MMRVPFEDKLTGAGVGRFENEAERRRVRGGGARAGQVCTEGVRRGGEEKSKE